MAKKNEPGHSMNAVYCDSAVCVSSGNSKREIRVWHIPGPEQEHSIPCPYCSSVLVRKLTATKIIKVMPDETQLRRCSAPAAKVCCPICF